MYESAAACINHLTDLIVRRTCAASGTCFICPCAVRASKVHLHCGVIVLGVGVNGVKS